MKASKTAKPRVASSRATGGVGEGPPPPSQGSDTEALGEIMLVQSTMQRQFLRALLRRIATDVPTFNAEMFLAELQILRESLSAPQKDGQPSAIRNFALKEWERLCDMAVDTIAATRVRQPEKH
jgi:hypothetical protein